jgi:hypothetical protein
MTAPPFEGGTGDPVAPPQGWTFWADASVPPFTRIGQIEVTGFTANWALGGFGAGEAVIPVEGNALDRLGLLQFYGYRLWAFYGGVPVWGGLPTGLTDDGGKSVRVALTELPGYLNVKQYATTHTYSQVEQTTIAGDLAARLDNIGVPRIIVAGPGHLRDRTYTYLQDNRGNLLTALCQVTNGPEFRSEYSTDSSGNPVCSLRIAYPRAGSNASGLALVVPAGAVTYEAVWTSDRLRTRTFAVGDLAPGASGTKPSVLVSTPQAGLPEIDQVDDFPGVTVLSHITERANTNAAIYASAALALTATMPVNAPPLGSYWMGDDVAVALADPLLPAALSAVGRLTGASVDAAAGTVSWTVTISQPPPRLTRHLAADLRYLRDHQAAMFRQNLGTPPGGTNP